MAMHSLTKSAIFFAVGHIAQVKGTQKIAEIRGLTVSHPWLGWAPGGRRGRDRRPAAARHLHERVPAGQLDLRPRSRCSRSSLVFGLLVAFGALLLRLNGLAFGEPRGSAAPVRGVLPADVRPSRRWCWWRASICRRRWSPGSSTSRARSADGGRRHAGARPICSCRATGVPRSPALAARAWSGPTAWELAGERLAQGRWTLLGLWGEARTVHMALLDERAGRGRVVSLDCPDERFPSVGPAHPPALRLERTIRDLFGLEPMGLPDRRAAGSTTAAGACAHPLGAADRSRDAPARPTRSCRPRARACTRSRSARCMPASSSPGISASPPTARPWSAWRSASATSTRASRP